MIDALKGHPEITAGPEMLRRYRFLIRPEEKFHPAKRLYVMTRRSWKGNPAEQQIRALEKFYSNSSRTTRAVGFKTKVSDIDDLEATKQFLESNRVKAIILDRKNVVKQAVSHISANHLYEKTKGKYRKLAWNLYDEKDRLGPIIITLEEFDKALRRMTFNRRVLQAFADYLQVPKLTLEYSDLLKNKDQWFSSIFNFLNVESKNLESTVLKNTDDDLQRAITNFQELKRGYAGTDFETMFEEI